jgi:hypothetical protein
MSATTYVILVNLPLLTLGMGAICAIFWSQNGYVSVLGRGSPLDMRLVGAAAMFGVWLLLSVGSLALAFFGGLVIFYLLLFWLGRAAAGAGAILILALLACIPFFWGWMLLKPAVRR